MEFNSRRVVLFHYQVLLNIQNSIVIFLIFVILISFLIIQYYYLQTYKFTSNLVSDNSLQYSLQFKSILNQLPTTCRTHLDSEVDFPPTCSDCSSATVSISHAAATRQLPASAENMKNHMGKCAKNKKAKNKKNNNYTTLCSTQGIKTIHATHALSEIRSQMMLLLRCT